MTTEASDFYIEIDYNSVDADGLTWVRADGNSPMRFAETFWCFAEGDGTRVPASLAVWKAGYPLDWFGLRVRWREMESDPRSSGTPA